LQFRLELRGDTVASRSFVNRQTSKALSLPREEFLLEFRDGVTLSSSQCSATISRKDRQAAELLFAHEPIRGQAVEVRVHYTLPLSGAYLRKQISVRQKQGTPLRLMRANLENWQGCQGTWDSMHADRYPFGSHPIFCEDLWAGVEFVAAFNEYSKNGFVLRSRPGGPQLGPDWLPLHSTVIGTAVRGQVYPAFLRYLDDVRLSPPRMVCCYNPWWTLPRGIVKEEEMLQLGAELKRRLFDRHGIFFDLYATDAGWTDRESIWEIDRNRLPHGFDGLRKIVESAGGRLGLWMSPSSMYISAIDYDWAARNGFTTVGKALSLADPRYYEKTRDSLLRLIRGNRLRHIKFDGFIPVEEVPHHGLLPGHDSVEPLAARAMELIAATKQADPDLVTEPTFLNSWATYISPWLIKYADSIFGNAGGDYPRAIGPAPDYRESCTNSREWYIFSSLKEVWLPQNALQYFDIVHCDAARGFTNHVATAIGRGRFFLPAYVNPKYVSDEEWATFAGLLRWARSNADVLRNTIVLPSRVEQGEPYAYAHWLGQRGIVAVRNPSNQTQTYRLDLRAAGAPPDLADAVCYTQFPYRKGLAAFLSSTAVVPVRLAPWELLFLEIVPRSGLQEPVALGARWYRDGQGKMRVAPDAGVKRVEVLQPGQAATHHDVPLIPPSGPAGKVLAHTVKRLPDSEGLKVAGKPRPTAAFDLDCEVAIPDGASGKVLLLLEFPGSRHFPSRCTATVNGQMVRLEEISSVGQMGYGVYGTFGTKTFWGGLIPFISEWTWYICPAHAGKSRIRFSGSVALPEARIGAWIWSEGARSVGLRSLPVPASPPQLPQVGDGIERQGVQVLAPKGE
jgi:hypothetical protein